MKNMKKLVLLLLVLGLVSLLVWGRGSIMPRTKAQSGFNNSVLNGNYAFTFSGFQNGVFTVADGVLFTDGNGGANGVIYTNPPGNNATGPGGSFSSPYTVNPNGTGFAVVTVTGTPVTTLVSFAVANVKDGVAQKIQFTQNTNAPGPSLVTSGEANLQRPNED